MNREEVASGSLRIAKVPVSLEWLTSVLRQSMEEDFPSNPSVVWVEQPIQGLKAHGFIHLVIMSESLELVPWNAEIPMLPTLHLEC